MLDVLSILSFLAFWVVITFAGLWTVERFSSRRGGK